jgi:hypothetical protein
VETINGLNPREPEECAPWLQPMLAAHPRAARDGQLGHDPTRQVVIFSFSVFSFLKSESFQK